ncbi:MAG TPA: protein kinase [Polyangiaceae bacterium]
MATSGKIIKGKWRVDARLGSGATATVYAATHRNGYRVAIKMLHVDLSRDTEIRGRFLREGYVANTIQHKGVVRVLDDDITDDGQVFLVLELLEGESMGAMLQKNGGRLPWMMVAEKMVELLDVLSAAHAQGVVHRDIKPDNVFITTENVLKVLDFGLARLPVGADKESTRTGAILGTPDFMSPEQAAGKNEEVDARSDLYSVAATAYVLMSGQPVHTATSLAEHLQMTANTDVRSLAKAAPWVPFQLVGVLDRALSRDKQKRWATAFEMQGALKAALEEADVVLVPDAPTVLDPEPSVPPPPMDSPAPVRIARPAAGVPANVQRPASVPPAVSVPSSRPAGPGVNNPAVVVPASRPPNLIVPSHRAGGPPKPAMGPLFGGASPQQEDDDDEPKRPSNPTVIPAESVRKPVPVPKAVAAAKAANGGEEEELIQRPDAPTRLDPAPSELLEAEQQEAQTKKPLAAWTERLLEAEAAETAVSRGVVPKNELQKSTPVGPISRPIQQRQIVPVPPPPTHDQSAPPGSIRVATKFEVDDTMQSPQGALMSPRPQGVPMPPPPTPEIRTGAQIQQPQPMGGAPLPVPQGGMPLPPGAMPPGPLPPGALDPYGNIVPLPAQAGSRGGSRTFFYAFLLLIIMVATFFVVRMIQAKQSREQKQQMQQQMNSTGEVQPTTNGAR